MSKTFLITKEMMDNLSYDEETAIAAKVTVAKDNSSKNKSEFLECVYDISKLTREYATTLVRHHLNELSAIESDQNYIPQYVTKRNLEIGLELVDKKIVTENQRTQKQTKALLAATSEISLLSIIRALVNAFQSEWSHVNIIFDSQREKFIKTLMENIFKTIKLNENQIPSLPPAIRRRASFCSMFVLKLSDLDAAAHHLVESFNDPTAPWKIGYVYVQENCFQEFCSKLKDKLKPYPKDFIRNPLFLKDHKDIEDTMKKLKAKTIDVGTNSFISPIICYEFSRDYFNNTTNDSKFTPIVILRSVRTVKEAITLAKTDKSNSASIWCANHSLAFEIVNNLCYSVFWINCHQILDICVPIKIGDLSKTDGDKFQKIYGKSGVHIKNSYHFEYFLCNEDKTDEFYKAIIFPIGVTFSN